MLHKACGEVHGFLRIPFQTHIVEILARDVSYHTAAELRLVQSSNMPPVFSRSSTLRANYAADFL